MKQWFAMAMMAAATAALVPNADAADDKKGKRGKGAGGPSLSRMDADGDGAVSLVEFQKARKAEDEAAMKKAAAMFKRIDADDNGTICDAEFKKWRENTPAKKRADKKAGE